MFSNDLVWVFQPSRQMISMFFIMCHKDFDEVFYCAAFAPWKYQWLIEFFVRQVSQSLYYPRVAGSEFTSAVFEVQSLGRLDGLGVIGIDAARRALRHRFIFGVTLQRLNHGIVPA